MLKLEDLALASVDNLRLVTCDSEYSVELDCSPSSVLCWAGVVPTPSVRGIYFNRFVSKLSVALDCNEDTLRRFHAAVKARCRREMIIVGQVKDMIEREVM